LLQLKGMILGNEGNALIAFSTPINGSVEDGRERLRSALAAFVDMPADLDRAGRAVELSNSLN
jgi:hypothetical protein